MLLCLVVVTDVSFFSFFVQQFLTEFDLEGGAKKDLGLTSASGSTDSP